MAKEYIERSTLDKWLHETMSVQTTVRGMAFVQMFWENVRSIPAADVVEVVRCKDCKHFDMQKMECQNEEVSTDHEGGASYSLNFYLDDFCSYGERRDNNAAD